jgi:hypothetical protein
MALTSSTRVLQDEGLGNESAHRPSQKACALEAEDFDYSRGVLGELGNIKWPPIVRGATDPAVVGKNQLVGRCKPVDKRRIPVRACRGETIQDHERWASSNSTASDLRSIDLDCLEGFSGHRRGWGESHGDVNEL